MSLKTNELQYVFHLLNHQLMRADLNELPQTVHHRLYLVQS